VRCEPWEWHDDDWRRFSTVKQWNIGSICVRVAGEQTHHGQVTRWLHVGGDDNFTKSNRRHLMEPLDDAENLLHGIAR
jgi:hypothetical protein